MGELSSSGAKVKHSLEGQTAERTRSRRTLPLRTDLFQGLGIRKSKVTMGRLNEGAF